MLQKLNKFIRLENVKTVYINNIKNSPSIYYNCRFSVCGVWDMKLYATY